MTVTTRAGKVPSVCAEVAELASIPAGVELLTRLMAIDRSLLTGHELVLYLRAWVRQSNFTDGHVMLGTCEVLARSDPFFGYAFDPACEFEMGVGAARFDAAGVAEVRAALTISRARSTRLCGLGEYLAVNLPMVLEAWAAGHIDRSRAEAFVRHTDGLSIAQQQEIATRLLPTAGSRVLGALVADILALGIEADPAHTERLRKRVRRGRRLEVGLNTTTGTGRLAVEDADAEVLASVGQRADAIGWATKKAARARNLDCRVDAIRADYAAHVLAGLVSNDDEEGIVDYLLGLIEAENAQAAQAAAAQADAPSEPAPTDAPTQPEPTDAPTQPEPEPTAPEAAGRVLASRRRRLARLVEGRALRVRLGLATLAGLDEHAGELIGTGPQSPGVCRRLATAPHAVWRLVLTDEAGRVSLVETLKARPGVAIAEGVGPNEGAGYRNVEILLTLTPAQVAALTAEPLVGWEQVMIEVAALATKPSGAPNGDDRDRFPNTRLRRFVEIRDELCRGVHCRLAANRCDCDHTIDYAKGGLTVDPNLGMVCRQCHGLKDYGWMLIQLEPGVFEWVSPLGHRYRVGRPEPLDTRPIPFTDVFIDDDDAVDDWNWASTCLWDETPTPPPDPPRPSTVDDDTGDGDAGDGDPPDRGAAPPDDTPPF